MTTSGASSPAVGAASLAYRPDIDGLRAIAVLAVVGFHGFPGHFPGGFLGVDIFFVISGYLITALLLHERDTSGTIDIAAFYARRIRRLFPALLIVIVATLAAGWWLLLAHESARLVNHVWASLFFVENILLATESGYFDVDAYEKPLLHFWSLAVEEQFYIVWPALLALPALLPRQAGLAIGIALALSLAITFSGSLGGAWHFYSPLTRVWELAAGAALSWWFWRRKESGLQVPVLAAGCVSTVSLIAIGAAILFGHEAMRHPGGLTIVPVLATVALIAVGLQSPINRLLATRPAVWTGLISYPLYLWHWPLLSYLSIVSVEERGPRDLRVAAVLAAFALAAATYFLVERPIRGAIRGGRTVTLLVSASLAVAIAAGALLAWRPGDSDKVAAVAQEQIEGVAWRWMANDLCREEPGQDFTAFCVQNRPGRPDVVLFGNSYVNHLYPGLAAHPDFVRRTIVGFGNCEPSRSLPEIYDDCDRQWALMRQMERGSLVLMSSQWPLFGDDGRMTDLQVGSPGTPEQYPGFDAYARALSAQVALLAELGHQIVIIGPKPELGYDMADCYARPLRPATRGCRAHTAYYLHDARYTLGMLRDMEKRHPNVHLFDLAAVFCGAEICDYRTREGYPLLRDGNGHLSEIGSHLVADRLAEWLKQKNLPSP